MPCVQMYGKINSRSQRRDLAAGSNGLWHSAAREALVTLMLQGTHLSSSTGDLVPASCQQHAWHLLPLTQRRLILFWNADAEDPPAIVKVNIYIRSISRIDDVTMVSPCFLSCAFR